jgi:isopenicillin N synthase-like dioxygenase
LTRLIAVIAFYGNNGLEKQWLVDEVRQACLEKGFFQIINHGVSDELQTAIFEQSKEFFSLPAEEKLRLDKCKW